MSDLIEIEWTSGSMDEARMVSRFLVQERLVANAQIIPWIESIYMLDNRLETAQESKILYKTRRDKLEKVKEVILQNCKYEIPEIIFRTIEDGHGPFLRWLEDSTPDFSLPQ